MQGCSWIVQVFAVFGALSLAASVVVIVIAIMADRADRRAVADPEVEDFGRPLAEAAKSFGGELRERVRGWWATADLGWLGFLAGVLVLGAIVLWLILDVANGRWELP